MPASPDPFDLVIFARVVNAGSFGGAAEQMGLPRSTVSRRITVLEGLLGEKVLQRTTRRVVLTEMGQRILVPAEQIAQEIDGVVAIAEHRQAIPSGQLRVSVPADLAGISLAPMLAAFSVAYPEVQLELDLSPRYVDVIAESYDLAIRVDGAVQDQRLTTRHLIDLGIGLYAAPSYLQRRGRPDDPRALAKHDILVLLGGGTPIPWKLEKGGEIIPTDVKPRRVAANSYELLFRLAMLGAGIAAMPDLFAAPHAAAGELMRVLPDWTMRPATVRAVFPSRQLMPRKTRAFLDAMLSFLKPSTPRDPAFAEAARALGFGDGSLPL
jgi:DNA-binding transcriptional LysR family regulator